MTTIIVSSPRPPSPSTSNSSHSHHQPYTDLNVFQQGPQQQHIPNPSPHFHDLTRIEGLAFEPSSPGPHDLSPVQPPQSHLAIEQTEAPEKHSCMWANCHAIFGSLQDLVAHVNVQHLQMASTLLSDDQLSPSQNSTSSHYQSTLNSPDQTFPSCRWGGCHVYPTAENVPSSSDRPVDAALGVLAAHLWEYHFGLPTPAPQFTFPSTSTPLVPEAVAELIHSPSLEGVVPTIQTSPADMEMIDMVLPTTSDPPLVTEVVLDAAASSESGTTPPHEDSASASQHREHDCATADHPCRWLDCQERFTTCEALMAHITAEHVGSGRNHYGCFWDGCGRNGNKGFKSKQKICRHLQVRSP